MKPLYLDSPSAPTTEAVPVWEVMASARAPQAPTATADGQLGHASLSSYSCSLVLAALTHPRCSHTGTSPGEMMTPPSCETQLWINWIPWEKTVQYQLVTLQREQHNELHLWSGALCAHSTVHTGAQLWSSQGWPWSHSQARDPRDPAEGAQWQQGRPVWM